MTSQLEYVGDTPAFYRKDLFKGTCKLSKTCVTLECDITPILGLGDLPLGNQQFFGHIDIQHHFVLEKVAEGKVDLRYVLTGEQVADGLTKALCKDKFLVFRKATGLE